MQVLSVILATWGLLVLLDLRGEARQQHLARLDEATSTSDLTSSVGFCAMFMVAQLLWRPLSSPVVRAAIPKKARWSESVWGAKIERCCDAIFKCVYFSALSIWGFALLREEGYTPWVLGGSGDTRNCWTEDSVGQPLRQFYMFAFGFHLSEMAMLAIDDKYPDFWEMLLHHIVACFLVFVSYALNYARIGSLVMLLHGMTDIFIYVSKALVDTYFTRLSKVAYMALATSYAWFRIFVFPLYIMRSAWLESTAILGYEPLAWGFMNFALAVLWFLHMYWFGLIIKIGIVFSKTGQARDLQSKLSSMDMHTKKAS